MKCNISKKCGGCQFQGIPYKEQLKKKQKKEQSLLGAYGKVCPIIGMENPYYYRNKVHAVFDRDRKGNIISGIYEEGTHRVVPVENCLIEDEKSQAIIWTIRGMLKSFKIRTYDEDTGYGLLRHVLIRRGFSTGEIMVVLVTGSPIFPSKNNFVKALRKAHPEITTVVLNVNDRQTSMVLGDREKPIFGPGFIKDRLCGCMFRISPKSFYQVNPVQTEILYQTAIDYAGLTGKETVIDAYCGIGTIGLIAAKKASKVIGVELNKDAVKDARINAKENKITNAAFYQGDAGRFMVEMAAKGEKADVVFMDPPRAGSAERFLSSVVKLSPKKVIYISCNPETLARDLKYLTKHHYKVEKIQPVDMFPFCDHVETVCCLVRETVNNNEIEYMHVDYEPEDAEYLKGIKGSATYAEIKAWIKKQYNVSVSSLYIAQCKDECGFEKRDNYNTGAEGHKVPNCPAEKRELIMKAFEHFKMI